MTRILVIADLEGIAQVDAVADLIFVSKTYPRAQVLMSQEVAIFAQALLDTGRFDVVRVVDSHLSGSGELNLRPDLMPPGVELRLEEDAYSEEVFADVDTVACLGMHVAAGSEGFVPHAVNLHCAWCLKDHVLSESDIVLALAAERGLSALMVSGDDVLERELLQSVPYVCTKTISVDTGQPQSILPEEAHQRLSTVAAASPVNLAPVSDAPIRLVFKSRWQAEAAEQAGGTRTGLYEITVTGPTFRERYRQAHALAAVSEDATTDAIRGEAGPEAMAEDLEILLRRPTGEAPMPPITWADVERASQNFLRSTEGPDQASLRAMTLQMLKRNAPQTLEALSLSELRTEAFSPSLFLGEAHGRITEIHADMHEVLSAASKTASIDRVSLGTATERLLFAVPWMIREGFVELAAQTILCLQQLGESNGPAHQALLRFILDSQNQDGTAHSASAVFVALAGAWNHTSVRRATMK